MMCMSLSMTLKPCLAIGSPPVTTRLFQADVLGEVVVDRAIGFERPLDPVGGISAAVDAVEKVDEQAPSLLGLRATVAARHRIVQVAVGRVGEEADSVRPVRILDGVAQPTHVANGDQVI